MSNAILFLETLGAHPALASQAAQRYGDVVGELDIDQAQQEALAKRDAVTLGALLGGRAQMWCYVSTPDNDEDSIVPNEDDQDGDGDSDEGDEVPSRPTE